MAYAVLDQVFDVLMDQGAFPNPLGKTPTLASKMNASVAHLSWVDYCAVDAGSVTRNEICKTSEQDRLPSVR